MTSYAPLMYAVVVLSLVLRKLLVVVLCHAVMMIQDETGRCALQ
eukprot:COSAG06_NODE_1813_length_8305_cov_5.110407_14_plen_44_part_00